MGGYRKGYLKKKKKEEEEEERKKKRKEKKHTYFIRLNCIDRKANS